MQTKTPPTKALPKRQGFSRKEWLPVWLLTAVQAPANILTIALLPILITSANPLPLLLLNAGAAVTWWGTDYWAGALTTRIGFNRSLNMKRRAIRHAEDESDYSNPLQGDLIKSVATDSTTARGTITFQRVLLFYSLKIPAAILVPLALAPLTGGISVAAALGIGLVAVVPSVIATGYGLYWSNREKSLLQSEHESERKLVRKLTNDYETGWLEFLRVNGSLSQESEKADVLVNEFGDSLWNKLRARLHAFSRVHFAIWVLAPMLPALLWATGILAISVPVLLAVTTTAISLQASALAIPQLLTQLREAQHAEREVDQFLEKKSKRPGREAEHDLTHEGEIVEIIFENVSYSVDGKSILYDINHTFDMSPGVICITGPSESGKTTLLRLLIGVIEPTDGRILYKFANGDTRDANDFSATTKWQRLWAYGPQHLRNAEVTIRDLLEMANVEANSDALSAFFRDADLPMDWSNLKQASGSNNSKDSFLQRRLDSFSGGTQKRLLTAVALHSNKSAVALDEPMTGAGNDLTEAWYRNLTSLATMRKRRVVVATHDLIHVYKNGLPTVNIEKSSQPGKGATIVASSKDARLPDVHHTFLDDLIASGYDGPGLRPWPKSWEVDTFPKGRYDRQFILLRLPADAGPTDFRLGRHKVYPAARFGQALSAFEMRLRAVGRTARIGSLDEFGADPQVSSVARSLNKLGPEFVVVPLSNLSAIQDSGFKADLDSSQATELGSLR